MLTHIATIRCLIASSSRSSASRVSDPRAGKGGRHNSVRSPFRPRGLRERRRRRYLQYAVRDQCRLCIFRGRTRHGQDERVQPCGREDVERDPWKRVRFTRALFEERHGRAVVRAEPAGTLLRVMRADAAAHCRLRDKVDQPSRLRCQDARAGCSREANDRSPSEDHAWHIDPTLPLARIPVNRTRIRQARLVTATTLSLEAPHSPATAARSCPSGSRMRSARGCRGAPRRSFRGS